MMQGPRGSLKGNKKYFQLKQNRKEDITNIWCKGALGVIGLRTTDSREHL